jgi:acyl-CoA reductase-like NAD-dependent aldehyde dehydrogenase
MDAAVVGRLSNTGQSCISAKRFIVLAGLYDALLDQLRERFAALTPGDPFDPATTLAPLSSEQAAENLVEQVRDTTAQGATVHLGGGRINRPGAFVQPTVLTDVKPGMRAYSEELFGPVAVIYRMENDDAAVALANVSPYGLGGAIFSSDLERAHRLAERLDSGMIWINHPTATQPELPFGGIKRSGFGRQRRTSVFTNSSTRTDPHYRCERIHRRSRLLSVHGSDTWWSTLGTAHSGRGSAPARRPARNLRGAAFIPDVGTAGSRARGCRRPPIRAGRWPRCRRPT